MLLSATGSLDEKTGDWIGDAQVVEEAKQVCYDTPVMDMLLCVNEVMFNKLKFAGADEDYFTHHKLAALIRLVILSKTFTFSLYVLPSCSSTALLHFNVCSLILSRLR
jgi:hypothetical protein